MNACIEALFPGDAAVASCLQLPGSDILAVGNPSICAGTLWFQERGDVAVPGRLDLRMTIN